MDGSFHEFIIIFINRRKMFMLVTGIFIRKQIDRSMDVKGINRVVV